MLEIQEEWRSVGILKNYGGIDYTGYYEVSSHGNIRSIERIVKNSRTGKNIVRSRILKPAIDNRGYKRVALCKDSTLRTYKVHRIVAEVFLLNPDQLPQINHINCIKTDNRASNLEWCDNRHNIMHAFENGLAQKIHEGSPIVQMDLEGNFISEYSSAAECIRQNPQFEKGSISRCVLGKGKQHKGFKFKRK